MAAMGGFSGGADRFPRSPGGQWGRLSTKSCDRFGQRDVEFKSEHRFLDRLFRVGDMPAGVVEGGTQVSDEGAHPRDGGELGEGDGAELRAEPPQQMPAYYLAAAQIAQISGVRMGQEPVAGPRPGGFDPLSVVPAGRQDGEVVKPDESGEIRRDPAGAMQPTVRHPGESWAGAVTGGGLFQFLVDREQIAQPERVARPGHGSGQDRGDDSRPLGTGVRVGGSRAEQRGEADRGQKLVVQGSGSR